MARRTSNPAKVLVFAIVTSRISSFLQHDLGCLLRSRNRPELDVYHTKHDRAQFQVFFFLQAQTLGPVQVPSQLLFRRGRQRGFCFSCSASTDNETQGGARLDVTVKMECCWCCFPSYGFSWQTCPGGIGCPLYNNVCSWLDDPVMPQLVRSACARQIFNDCCAHFGMNCNMHKVVQQAIQNAQQRVMSATDWKRTDQLQAVKSAFELVRGEVLYALYQKCGLSSREAQECAQADYQIDKPLLDVAECRIASIKRSGMNCLRMPSEYRQLSGLSSAPAPAFGNPAGSRTALFHTTAAQSSQAMPARLGGIPISASYSGFSNPAAVSGPVQPPSQMPSSLLSSASPFAASPVDISDSATHDDCKSDLLKKTASSSSSDEEHGAGDSCVICMSAPVQAGFLHGSSVHKSVCQECLKKLEHRRHKRCPVCNQRIERFIQNIY